MSLTAQQIEMLSAHLDRSHVRSRQQAGRPLSYLESWHCIAEANRIFGFDGWHSEVVEMRVVSERERGGGKEGWVVSYVGRVRVTVQCGDKLIIRDGVGAGHGIDRDLGQAHESAAKECESDCRKRSLMTWGNPFGLALYDKSQSNVSDAPQPKPSQAIASAVRGWVDDEPQQEAKPQPKAAAKPAAPPPPQPRADTISATIRARLLEGLGGVYTISDFETWKAGDGFRTDFGRMSPADRSAVEKAALLKKKAVTPAGAVRGA